MKCLTLIVATLSLAGCLNISTELQPANQSVQPSLEGTSCRTIFAGMGFGSNTFAEALRHTAKPGQSQNIDRGLGEVKAAATIVRIHSVELIDSAFIWFGERCLKVTGEP